MDRNYARALPLVLRHEGGFSDNPKDPGGPTNRGVTIATFRRYVKADATIEDLKAITSEQVATVYYRHYWSVVNVQALPAGVDYAVFDFAVHSGPARAAKFLQHIVGVKTDGRVGPATIAAVNAMDAREIVNKLCDDRMTFLRGLPAWPTFKNGWTTRVAEVRRAALSFVGMPADVKEVPVPVDKPVVPPSVDKEVQKKMTFWQWLTGLIGSGGLGLGWLAGADWQAIAAGGAVLLVFLIVILLLRHQIIGAVKEIRGNLS